MWEPQPLATLRASTACTGITLPYLYGGRNGKAAKPRCFKNPEINNLPVIWRNNKKA
jgi:hypothetical protein